MRKNDGGFTLLEIMIATVIMAFLTIFTAHMISEGVYARSKIEGNIDRETALHDALALMQQDIEKAFNYRDLYVELYNQAQRDRQQGAQVPQNPAQTLPGQPPAQPPPATANQFPLEQEKIYTEFKGGHHTLNFDSLNNFRSQKNEQVSDQCEIGYYVASCVSLEHPHENIQCLWRRVSPYITNNVKEGGHATPILEDVKSLRFRYLGYGHVHHWIGTWNNVTGETDMRGRLPMAVEATVSIYDRRFHPPHTIAMTIVAMPYFLNNPPANENPTGVATPATPPGTVPPTNGAAPGFGGY